MVSTHQLPHIIRRPPRLSKAQTPLDSLQILPGHLIAHDMRLLITLMQLLAGAALMDTDHGDADRPGGLTDAKTEVAIVGGDVAPLLGVTHDGADRGEDAVGEVLAFESAEERGQVADGLVEVGAGLAAWVGFLGGKVALGEGVGPFAEEEGELAGELAEEEASFGCVGGGDGGGDEHVGFWNGFEGGGDGAVG
jgi:hypothetical protein